MNVACHNTESLSAMRTSRRDLSSTALCRQGPDRSVSYFLARTSWLGGHLCVARGCMSMLEGPELSGVGLSSPMVPSGSCCWEKTLPRSMHGLCLETKAWWRASKQTKISAELGSGTQAHSLPPIFQQYWHTKSHHLILARTVSPNEQKGG